MKVDFLAIIFIVHLNKMIQLNLQVQHRCANNLSTTAATRTFGIRTFDGEAFKRALDKKKFNDLSNWDNSNITDMSSLFWGNDEPHLKIIKF